MLGNPWKACGLALPQREHSVSGALIVSLWPGLSGAAPAAGCLARGRLGTQAPLFESWRALSSRRPTSRSSVLWDCHAGSGNGRQGIWKLGPAAFWASGRGASGLLRIAPSHGSASQWAAVHLPGPGPGSL